MKKIFLSVLVSLFSAALIAGGTPPADTAVSKVGVLHVPPYVILEGKTVSGLAVSLWKDVADSLGIRYEFVKYEDLGLLINDMSAGKIDFCLTPRTIHRPDINGIRMTVPFATSKVSAVILNETRMPVLTVLGNLFNRNTTRVYCFALIFILLFAILIWLVERKKNPAHFHPSPRGIFDGIWWAIVTMATVGYGDTVPKTRLGRFLTLVWILFAIALLFLITSEISSELTIAKLEKRSLEVKELRTMKTVTIGNTGYAEELVLNGIPYVRANNMTRAFAEVISGKSEAFVFDKAILQYVLDHLETENRLTLIPTELNDQYLCLSAGAGLEDKLDDINQSILEITETYRWKEELVFYNMPR